MAPPTRLEGQSLSDRLREVLHSLEEGRLPLAGSETEECICLCDDIAARLRSSPACELSTTVVLAPTSLALSGHPQMAPPQPQMSRARARLRLRLRLMLPTRLPSKPRRGPAP